MKIIIVYDQCYARCLVCGSQWLKPILIILNTPSSSSWCSVLGPNPSFMNMIRCMPLVWILWLVLSIRHLAFCNLQIFSRSTDENSEFKTPTPRDITVYHIAGLYKERISLRSWLSTANKRLPTIQSQYQLSEPLFTNMRDMSNVLRHRDSSTTRKAER